MEEAEIVKHLSPCGLDCTRCADYIDGKIQKNSRQLAYDLGNYSRMANMRQQHQPVFAQYAAFREVLEVFSQASCGGCRSDSVNCPIACTVRDCHRKKGVDFCFQCQEFPCSKQDVSIIKERWQKNNERIKEVGLKAYYEESLLKQRY